MDNESKTEIAAYLYFLFFEHFLCLAIQFLYVAILPASLSRELTQMPNTEMMFFLCGSDGVVNGETADIYTNENIQPNLHQAGTKSS